MTTKLAPREYAERILAAMEPRFTIVKLAEREGAEEIAATATCSRFDQFDRKQGIRLAFRRALKRVPR